MSAQPTRPQTVEVTPDEARLAWFAAEDREARERCVERLVELAAGPGDVAVRARATGHLIELVHLARHPVDRCAGIDALARTGMAFAVPALHAELQRPEPEVRRAALDALGALGEPFGGALVARWVAARDLQGEAPALAEAALLALARTGHPDTNALARRLWEAGAVSPRVLHLALAEVASPLLLEQARQHVALPEAALAAALHLASRRVDDLEGALEPLRRSGDLAHVHVAERLMAAPRRTPEDDLLALLEHDGTTADRGRAARRLRVHPARDLLQGVRTLRGMEPAGSAERRRFLHAVMLIGVPAVQTDLLDWLEAEGDEGDLRAALGACTQRTAELRARLDRLIREAPARLARQALRCRVNVLGDLSPADLDTLARRRPQALTLEAVRGLTSLYRDQKAADRRTRLRGAARTTCEAFLRRVLAEGDPASRRLAAYAVGNLGLNGLGQDLGRLLDAGEADLRQAAAASLSVLPPALDAARLCAACQAESEPHVRFRLGLCLLDVLEGGAAVDDAALAHLCDTRLGDRGDLRVLGLRLRGHVRQGGADDVLVEAAADARLARSAAALTALGHRDSPRACQALLDATRAEDPDRRLRAVEALALLEADEVRLRLVEVATTDDHTGVRRAALHGLARRPAPATALSRLVPRGPDDPLVFEILQARAAIGGGGLGVDDVDEALVRAVPYLRPEHLGRRCPEALQALRTAEFLSHTVRLPDGLDASPPVLYWVKGLELWLDLSLRHVHATFRRPEVHDALKAQGYRWTGLRGQTPGWQDADETPWRRIYGTTIKSLQRSNQTMSLTIAAGLLLMAGPLAATLHVPAVLEQQDPGLLARLSRSLVGLARDRNRLAHREAGAADETAEVRARARAVASTVARVFG